MGLRETLQTNQQFATVAFGLIILLAIGVIIYELRGGPRPSAAMSRTFYSDDDGDSWFLADPTHLSPFDHNGKTAYLASVYRCPSSNRLFVTFLKKLPDATLKEAQAGVASDPKSALHYLSAPMDMKRPHDGRWIPASQVTIDLSYPKIPCPGGSEMAVPASPADPDVVEHGMKN